eukprot:4811965-Prymnesium_polylepis.1
MPCREWAHSSRHGAAHGHGRVTDARNGLPARAAHLGARGGVTWGVMWGHVGSRGVTRGTWAHALVTLSISSWRFCHWGTN